MSKPTTRELLLARKTELEGMLATLNAAASPIREERDARQAAIEKETIRIHELNAMLKKIEQPNKGALETQIAAVNKALSDKAMAAMEVTG